MPAPPHADQADPLLVRAVHARGLFVHLYAMVENIVTELVVRAADDDRFSGLGRPPYGWEGKLKRFSSVIAADGALSEHGQRLRHLLKSFTGIEQHRHHLIHGMLSFAEGDQPELLTFSYHHIAGGEVFARVWKISIGDLEAMADALASFTAEFVPSVLQAMSAASIAPVPLSELTEYVPEERLL